ncbi:glycosyltransferase family 2 protein [Pseudomonas argentinensis]|uniref:glycosyltransferase family 2 protein n=1 Tax=Phytopseudomonas argentinensis TaxID=289370 RepID=UPI0008A864CC|nr:glycosyltransferase family A protein [Pseudomonas argentinensis]
MDAADRGQRRAPKVSVVIPSYNYACFLGQAIASLQAQSWADWEAIIVDDGSTDDTERVAAQLLGEDSRIVYVRQPNGGTSAAKNTGIRHASGEYLMFLDADDLLTTNKLAAHIGHFQNNPHIDISYSRFRYFLDGHESCLFTKLDLSSEQEWAVAIDGRHDVALPVFLRGNNMAIHAAMVRKSMIDRVGDFDTEMRALEDWDYWLRCILRGAHLAFLDNPQVLALTRVHKNSATQTLDFSDYKLRVYEKVRQEALGLRGEGEERLQALLDKELQRLERRERKRLLKTQRRALQARIRGAGLLDFRELSLIAEQYGRINCLAVYLRVLLKSLSEWR